MTTTTQADTFQYTTAQDLRALLADAPALFELEEAFVCAPVDMEALACRMAELVQSNAVTRLEDHRADVRAAVRACAIPGYEVDDEFAAVLDEAMLTIGRMVCAEQDAMAQAFAKARHLLDTLGEDDPRAMAAVMDAIELKDPGCCDRMMKECGIHLPEPTHVDAQGHGLLSLEQVAEALGADPADLLEAVASLEEAGFPVHQQPAGRLQ